MSAIVEDMREARPGYRLMLLFFALGVLQVGVLLGLEAWRSYALSRSITALKAENQALWAEVRRLRAEVARADDPAYLEALVRSQLGWVRKDEILYARKPH